jgi:hypothetical protein
MRFLPVVVILGFGLQLSAQQDCRTNLFLDATLDTSAFKSDTAVRVKKDTTGKNSRPVFVDYAAVRTKYYLLKPPAPAYQIISFMVTTEENEYIIEVPCQGDIVCHLAERAIRQRKSGTPVYFTCIRVKYPNGKIYTLKDLTVNLP